MPQSLVRASPLAKPTPGRSALAVEAASLVVVLEDHLEEGGRGDGEEGPPEAEEGAPRKDGGDGRDGVKAGGPPHDEGPEDVGLQLVRRHHDQKGQGRLPQPPGGGEEQVDVGASDVWQHSPQQKNHKKRRHIHTNLTNHYYSHRSGRNQHQNRS